MYVHQIWGTRYSAQGSMSPHVVVRDDSSQIQIDMDAEETAELEALALKVYARHQQALIAKMQKPLETYLLTPPAPPSGPVDAEFTEVEI